MMETGEQGAQVNPEHDPVHVLFTQLTEEGVVEWENEQQRQSVQNNVRSAVQRLLGHSGEQEKMLAVCALLGQVLRNAHAVWSSPEPLEACQRGITLHGEREFRVTASDVELGALRDCIQQAREELCEVLVYQKHAAKFIQTVERISPWQTLELKQMLILIKLARACIDIQRRKDSGSTVSYGEEQEILCTFRIKGVIENMDDALLEAIEQAFLLPTDEDTEVVADEDEEEMDLGPPEGMEEDRRAGY